MIETWQENDKTVLLQMFNDWIKKYVALLNVLKFKIFHPTTEMPNLAKCE